MQNAWVIGDLITMTIKEIQEQIIEEFAVFDDWMDKYAYLIDLGNALPVVSDKIKAEQNLIKGCQSRVWIDASYNDGLVHFDADSDAIIVKGIVALLMRIYNDKSPLEIMSSELFFAEEIGLSQHLSPTRSNGLLSMIKQIKLYGMAFNAKFGG